MTLNDFLYLSYNSYSNGHTAIITIGDGDFISATEFFNLLKDILNCNKITPYIVNKLLIDKGFLIKNIAFNKEDLTSSKYLPVNEKGLYYKKIYFNTKPFYIWDYKILFNIFDINFQKELTKDSAKNKGMEEIVLMRLMGHTDYQTTQKYYIRISSKRKKLAMQEAYKVIFYERKVG